MTPVAFLMRWLDRLPDHLDDEFRREFNDMIATYLPHKRCHQCKGGGWVPSDLSHINIGELEQCAWCNGSGQEPPQTHRKPKVSP